MLKLSLLFFLTASISGIARADTVDRYLVDVLRTFRIPGATVAVIRNGKIAKIKGYGFANLETRTPAGPQTVFEIGSMTKQFTAAAVMRLVEDGKIRPEDPVGKYIPDAPKAWGGITVRHLLSHTSGIRNHVAIPGFLDIFKTSITGKTAPGRNELLAEFYKLPLEFEPGESWAYDNTGYILLGYIIENVSGRSYWQFLEERIFKPLGMSATRNTDPAAIIPFRANGYAWNGERWENRPVLAPFVGYSAGSLVSTAGDLAKWDAALRSGKLLSADSLRSMRTPATTENGDVAPFDYGYGWFAESYRGRVNILHSGGTPGFSSVMHQYPEDRLTVILLTNHADTILEQAALRIAAIYEPKLRYRSVRDPDPERTAKHRSVFEKLLKERFDPGQFTRAMALHLNSATGKSFFGWYASLGTLNSFSFLEHESLAKADVFRYEVKLADRAYRFSFKVGKDGRIAQIFPW